MSDKTEKPTPKRMLDARKNGDKPRSPAAYACVSWSLSLCSALVVFSALKPSLRRFTVLSLASGTTGEAIRHILQVVCIASFAIALSAAAGPILLSWATDRFALILASPRFQLDRLGPKPWFSRLRSLEPWREAFAGLVIATLLLLVGYRVTRLFLPFRTDAFDWLFLVSTRLVAAASAVSVVDFGWALWRHQKKLMMSKEEVKQEYKSSEGDPHQKQHRKTLHRAASEGGPRRHLQDATALVVNPTHVAVALRYDESECDVPYVVARATGTEAAQLRLLARRLGIPIVKNIGLARSLVRHLPGESIPEELYQAAAAVLAEALNASDIPSLRPAKNFGGVQ